jgi:pseudaminic acid cytidylyltransferase
LKLAVIPARGGSKRIPRKNIREFCGKPIIAWSIEAALESACFDHVIVSTDDEEIADIAKQYGADIPFMRPAELANDTAATIPVIKHAIEWFSDNQQKPELTCCIYATAPFVTKEDLIRGRNEIVTSGADYAFSVTSYAFAIQRAIQITNENRVEMFEPEHFNTRSQDLTEAYHDAGQFYWGKSDAWLASKPIFNSDAVPVILPRHRVQDIDTQEDWLRAELMFKAIQSN